MITKQVLARTYHVVRFYCTYYCSNNVDIESLRFAVKFEQLSVCTSYAKTEELINKNACYDNWFT